MSRKSSRQSGSSTVCIGFHGPWLNDWPHDQTHSPAPTSLLRSQGGPMNRPRITWLGLPGDQSPR
jgi:hypothetical protein